MQSIFIKISKIHYQSTPIIMDIDDHKLYYLESFTLYSIVDYYIAFYNQT